MTIRSVYMHKKFHDADIISTLTIVNERENVKEDATKIPPIIVLRYLLRGYPFGKKKKVTIGYYQDNRIRSYHMSVKQKRTESVRLKDRVINCFRLECSLEGMVGKFLPKQKYWYSVAPPHYLVRFKGPGWIPGSPSRTIEIADYNAASRREQLQGNFD